jgi:hypothetical protein
MDGDLFISAFNSIPTPPCYAGSDKRLIKNIKNISENIGDLPCPIKHVPYGNGSPPVNVPCQFCCGYIMFLYRSNAAGATEDEYKYGHFRTFGPRLRILRDQ